MTSAAGEDYRRRTSADAAEASDGEEEAAEEDEAGTSAGEGAEMAEEEGDCVRATGVSSQRSVEAAEVAAAVQEAEAAGRAYGPVEAERAATAAAVCGPQCTAREGSCGAPRPPRSRSPSVNPGGMRLGWSYCTLYVCTCLYL